MADALKLAFVLSATDKMSRIISDAVNKSTGKLRAFERNTSKVGKSMMAAGGIMTGASVAIGTATLGIAKTTAAYGDEVWKASQSTGMAVEDYQKLAYAARYSNVQQTELNGAVVKLNKKLAEAGAGSKSTAKLFTDLGVNVRDSAGNLKTPNAIFTELAGKFAGMENGAQKTALAYELFGRSGANLIPLLNSGTKGLEDMGAEAERMGYVMSTEAAKASEQFNDNLSRVTDSAKGLMFQLGTALIPTLDTLAQKVTAAVLKVSGWIKENPYLANTISTIFIGLTALLGVVGGASVVIGAVTFTVGKFAAAWRGVMTAISVGKALFAAASNGMLLFRIQYAALVIGQKLAAVAQWLFNSALYACPVVWIIATIMAVIGAVYLLVKHWDKVSAFFVGLWDGIKKVFVSVWNWIKNLFTELNPVSWISGIWNSITAWFGRLWDGVKNVFSSAWDWIKQMFLNYTPVGLIIKHWDTIVEWFAGLWEGVKGIFSNAWEGIKGFFSSLNPVEWFGSMWESVTTFFTELPGRFFGFGRDIINGLTDGIKSLASEAWESVTGIGEGIKNKFKSFFGINSPSTLFAEYGLNITQGLTSGIEKGTPAVAATTEGLAVEATRNIGNGITAVADSSTTPINNAGGVSLNYSPTINIGGGATPEVAAEFIKLLRAHREEIIRMIRQETENKKRLSFN